MPAPIHITVSLSSIRNQSGVMTVTRSGQILGRFQVLGRGSQGGGDTQLQVSGNTPTGSYRATRTVSTEAWNQSSYGPSGAIRLDPIGGNAVTSGRSGILIHGGSPGGSGYWRGAGELRATHGCLRLSNADVAQLARTLSEGHADPAHNQSAPYIVQVTVKDYEMSFARP